MPLAAPEHSTSWTTTVTSRRARLIAWRALNSVGGACSLLLAVPAPNFRLMLSAPRTSRHWHRIRDYLEKTQALFSTVRNSVRIRRRADLRLTKVQQRRLRSRPDVSFQAEAPWRSRPAESPRVDKPGPELGTGTSIAVGSSAPTRPKSCRSPAFEEGVNLTPLVPGTPTSRSGRRNGKGISRFSTCRSTAGSRVDPSTATIVECNQPRVTARAYRGTDGAGTLPVGRLANGSGSQPQTAQAIRLTEKNLCRIKVPKAIETAKSGALLQLRPSCVGPQRRQRRFGSRNRGAPPGMCDRPDHRLQARQRRTLKRLDPGLDRGGARLRRRQLHRLRGG